MATKRLIPLNLKTISIQFVVSATSELWHFVIGLRKSPNYEFTK